MNSCVKALGALLVVASCNTSADDSVAALKQEVEALKARLELLEGRMRVMPQVETLDVTSTGSSAVTSAAGSGLGAERSAEPETLVKGTDEASAETAVNIGGALRFNVVYRDDVDLSEGKRGESGLDVFRLNVDGELNNILISAEYRFYSYMNTIHHGWIGYEFEDDSQIQFGINQVPFGLLPYAAHNAWYGVPYYVGLGDDYDMGVKYLRADGPWSAQIAFYKNEELNNATSADRYSYDLVREGDQQNEEINQINGRLAYTFGLGSSCETELGTSLESGEIYNALTDDRGDRWAAAVHVDSRCGRWNFQLQRASYEYSAADPVGVDNSVVRLGAFADTYDVAADADIWVANIAYNFPSPLPQIDSITCYNDYSHLNKDLNGADNSQINTLGCAIGSGPLFTYIDYILAKNMPYFGGGSLGYGGEDDWLGRLNINIGYYW